MHLYFLIVVAMSGRIFTRSWLLRPVLKPRAVQFRQFHAGCTIREGAPIVDFTAVQSNPKGIQFGDYGLIASQSPIQRTYVEVKDIGSPTGPRVGDTVWLRGRIANIRAKGNACFLVIRAGSFYTIQACHFKDKESAADSKALLKYATDLTQESIVDIQGTVASADVKSCSQKNVEIHIRKLFVVSRAPSTLPFLLDDAARPESEIEETAGSDRPLVGVAQVRDLQALRLPFWLHISGVHSVVLCRYAQCVMSLVCRCH